MKITHAKVQEYALPFLKPIATSTTTKTHRRGWLLSLSSKAKNTGYGDAATWPGFGSDSDITQTALQHAAKVLIDQEINSVDDIKNVLTPEIRRSPEATYAVELALLDLLGQQLNKPIAELLSAKPSGSVPVCVLVTDVDDAVQATEGGARSLKVKVGAKTLADDIHHIAAIRQAVGPSIAIRLDVNGGWSTAQARAALDQLSAYAIEWLEQPLPTHSLQETASLCVETEMAIALDENVTSASDLATVIDNNAANVIVIKPMVVGGLLAAQTLAHLAKTANMTAVVSTMLESAVGRMGAVHLACALGSELPAMGLGQPLKTDVISGALTENGRVTLPTAAGLGLVPKIPEPDIQGATDMPVPFRSAALSRPNHPALIVEDEVWTARQLSDRAAKRASMLAEKGIGPGSVVALCGPSDETWITAFNALGFLGACVAPIDYRATSEEQQSAILSVAAEHVITTDTLPTISESQCSVKERYWPLDEPRLRLLTSGTSGTPKVVTITTAQLLYSAFGSATRLGLDPADRWLGCLPLHHIGGLSVVMRSAMYGTTVELHNGFDAKRVAAALDSGNVSLVSLVPAMLSSVLEARSAVSFPSQLRAILVGGAATPTALVEQCQAIQAPLALTWGMTEAASQIATSYPGAPLTTGTPLPFARVENTGGLLTVKGPLVGQTYTTQDRGHIDTDGRVVVTGRADDVIISGGKNIDPGEIEALLLTHPNIADVAVYAIENEQWGQRPAALIVAADEDVIPTNDELKSFCSVTLSKFKVPDLFEWTESIPRNQMGKLRRCAL